MQVIRGRVGVHFVGLVQEIESPPFVIIQWQFKFARIFRRCIRRLLKRSSFHNRLILFEERPEVVMLFGPAKRDF